jgi:hypothetical protein
MLHGVMPGHSLLYCFIAHHVIARCRLHHGWRLTLVLALRPDILNLLADSLLATAAASHTPACTCCPAAWLLLLMLLSPYAY